MAHTKGTGTTFRPRCPMTTLVCVYQVGRTSSIESTGIPVFKQSDSKFLSFPMLGDRTDSMIS